jgi:hypothetical protein
MSKIGFPGGSRGPAGPVGSAGAGSPVDSRASSGIIYPDTSGAYSVGTSAQPFGSVLATTVNTSGIQFDTTVGDNSVHSPGLMFWDDAEKTVALYTDEPDVKLQVGQELWVFARNNSGATISGLQAVTVNGAQGNRPTIALAHADSDESIENLIGIATHDIENNSDGYITINGVVNDVDTTGPGAETWNDGDEVYISATVSGQLTNIRPEAPNYVVHVGHILNAHANQGKLLTAISPTNFADPVTFKHIDILDGVHMYSDILTDTPSTRSIGTATSGFKEVHADTGNFDNVVVASSGTFPSGVVLVSPNGSGWLLTVDNTGAVNTSEPFVV